MIPCLRCWALKCSFSLNSFFTTKEVIHHQIFATFSFKAVLWYSTFSATLSASFGVTYCCQIWPAFHWFEALIHSNYINLQQNRTVQTPQIIAPILNWFSTDHPDFAAPLDYWFCNINPTTTHMLLINPDTTQCSSSCSWSIQLFMRFCVVRPVRFYVVLDWFRFLFCWIASSPDPCDYSPWPSMIILL